MAAVFKARIDAGLPEGQLTVSQAVADKFYDAGDQGLQLIRAITGSVGSDIGKRWLGNLLRVDTQEIGTSAISGSSDRAPNLPSTLALMKDKDYHLPVRKGSNVCYKHNARITVKKRAM